MCMSGVTQGIEDRGERTDGDTIASRMDVGLSGWRPVI